MPDIAYNTGRVYHMPDDGQLFRSRWWTAADAAAAWGCAYGTARRWMCLHPDRCAYVPIKTRRARGAIYRLCIPAGSLKTIRALGNPCMLDPAWQRDMARRRWQRRADERARSARRKYDESDQEYNRRIAALAAASAAEEPPRHHRAHRD